MPVALYNNAQQLYPQIRNCEMRLPRKGISVLREVCKSHGESYLLKVLESEIRHELSTPRFQEVDRHCSVADFSVDWDGPNSQDVLLRRRCPSGEEVAVSALLSPYQEEFVSSNFQRFVDMKVLVKKQYSSPVLMFDCEVTEKEDGGSSLHIRNASYLPSTATLKSSSYSGPEFWMLDDRLKGAFMDYLTSRGINEELLNFLLLHLNKKEQTQYVLWLQKLKSIYSSVLDS